MNSFVVTSVIETGKFVAAIGVVSGAMYTVGDSTGYRPIIKNEFRLVMEQMQQNSQAVLQIQFQLLEEKRQRGGLTFLELQQYCDLAKTLGYVQVPGCGF